MPDALSPVVIGQRIESRADTWNLILDAARAHRQGGCRGQSSGYLSYGGVVEALALNSTGANLAAYKPATVTAAGGIDVTGDGGPPWQQAPLLTLGVPAAATDFVVVTLDAIPDGAIGRVAVAGACLCDVHVNSSGHAFANPTTNTTALESAATGQIRVLHKGTGSSTRRCAAYLGDQMPAAAAPSLSSAFALTAGPTTLTGNGTWVDVCSVSLAAGTWLLWYAIGAAFASATLGDYVASRLDLSGGVCVAVVCNTTVAGATASGQAGAVYLTTLGSPTTVKLQASRNYSGAAPSVSAVYGGTASNTGLLGLKIS